MSPAVPRAPPRKRGYSWELTWRSQHRTPRPAARTAHWEGEGEEARGTRLLSAHPRGVAGPGAETRRGRRCLHPQPDVMARLHCFREWAVLIGGVSQTIIIQSDFQAGVGQGTACVSLVRLAARSPRADRRR